MYVNIVALFQVISGFKNSSHGCIWGGHDLQTGNFSQVDASTSFQAMSSFKNSGNGSGLDGRDLQTVNFAITFSKQFQLLRTVTSLIMGLDQIDVIFRLATLDEIDDINNLNQSIWT